MKIVSGFSEVGVGEPGASGVAGDTTRHVGKHAEAYRPPWHARNILLDRIVQRQLAGLGKLHDGVR